MVEPASESESKRGMYEGRYINDLTLNHFQGPTWRRHCSHYYNTAFSHLVCGFCYVHIRCTALFRELQCCWTTADLQDCGEDAVCPHVILRICRRAIVSGREKRRGGVLIERTTMNNDAVIYAAVHSAYQRSIPTRLSRLLHRVSI